VLGIGDAELVPACTARAGAFHRSGIAGYFDSDRGVYEVRCRVADLGCQRMAIGAAKSLRPLNGGVPGPSSTAKHSLVDPWPTASQIINAIDPSTDNLSRQEDMQRNADRRHGTNPSRHKPCRQKNRSLLWRDGTVSTAQLPFPGDVRLKSLRCATSSYYESLASDCECPLSSTPSNFKPRRFVHQLVVFRSRDGA